MSFRSFSARPAGPALFAALLVILAVPAPAATAEPAGLAVSASDSSAATAAPTPLPASVGASTLTLDDAIRLALQRNPTLRVSAFSPDIARAQVLAELGRFEPALTFRRTFGETASPVAGTTPLATTLVRQDDYALSVGGLTPWGLTYSLGATAENQRGTFNRFSDDFVTFGGLSVTQPLLRGFGFGANLASLRIAKADRGLADWEHRQTVIDVVTDVVLVYTGVLQARENVRIAELSRDLTARLVAQNRTRNRVGQISDADVLQAEARLAGREENVLLARRAAADLGNRLRQLVGDTDFPVDGPAFALDPLVPPPPLTPDPAADLARARVLRPDLRAARLGVDRRRAGHDLARHQLLPRVDFVGSYGYSGQDRDFGTARAQVRDRDARAYSAGLVVTVPLGFAEGRGRARAAALGVKQSEAELARVEQELALAVATAAANLGTTRRRVEAARTALDLAARSLEAEQKKFTAGTSTTFLVLQAQELLAAAESGYVRAVADERRARAVYERELGTTLESRGLRLD